MQVNMEIFISSLAEEYYKGRYSMQTIPLRKHLSTHIFAHGLCFYYAYVAMITLGSKVQVYSYIDDRFQGGHCFLKIGNKYYDADNLNGVAKWQQLQGYMKGARKIRRHLKPVPLLKAWGVYPENKFDDNEIITFNLFTEIAQELNKQKIKNQVFLSKAG